VRKILREQIRKMYRTQDKCAYSLGINNSTLSRIVGGCKDPNIVELEKLKLHLHLTEREINTKEVE